MEIIKLNYKRHCNAGSYYTCEITDKLNEIVGVDDNFLICNNSSQGIYRIHYNNISIGDLLCIRENEERLYDNVSKFTLYTGNLEYIKPRISNKVINQIYSYLNSLENNVSLYK